MVTKGHGFTVDDIDWSCPADLEPYEKAHREEIKEADSLLYSAGLYNKIAFEVVMSHFAAGLANKKSKAEYLDKPLLAQIEEKSKPMKEKELQKQRELFVAKLLVMQSNFEINHPDKKRKD